MVTGEGFLSGVGPHVALQQPGAGEGFTALPTFTGEGVGPDVHLESRLGVVVLVTVLAGELLLDLVGGVQLLVLQVARLGREALLALVTVVGLHRLFCWKQGFCVED